MFLPTGQNVKIFSHILPLPYFHLLLYLSFYFHLRFNMFSFTSTEILLPVSYGYGPILKQYQSCKAPRPAGLHPRSLPPPTLRPRYHPGPQRCPSPLHAPDSSHLTLPRKLVAHDADNWNVQDGADQVELHHLAQALGEGEQRRYPLHHHGVTHALQKGERVTAPRRARGGEGQERQIAQARLNGHHYFQRQVVGQQPFHSVQVVHGEEEGIPRPQGLGPVALPGLPCARRPPAIQGAPQPACARRGRRGPPSTWLRFISLGACPAAVRGAAGRAGGRGPGLQVHRAHPHRVSDALEDLAGLRVRGGAGHPGQHQCAGRRQQQTDPAQQPPQTQSPHY